MKPEQDDKRLEGMIRRAVGSEDAQFDPDSWKKKYHKEVAFLESGKTHSATTGHTMGRTYRSIKIAASAVLAAGIVAAIIIFAAGGGSIIAMADVLEQLQTKCYEFEMSLRVENNASRSLKGMVLEPGKMRLEQRIGHRTYTNIFDTNTGESLLLSDGPTKTALRGDIKKAKQADVLGFFILPNRSIESLWGLKAGNETPLGKKDIDGKSAVGFRVNNKFRVKINNKYEDLIQTITVWADAKTGHPLKVEVVLQDSKEEKTALELTLYDFRVIPEPNKALFSMKIPAGFTLANSQTLEELTADSDTTTPTAKNTSAGAEKVLKAIALWADGKKQKAVELIMTVDWNADIRFGQEHYWFTITGRQYMSLKWADQKKVDTGKMTQSLPLRAIAREMVKLGREARSSRDFTQAKKYLTTTVRLGHLLNRNNDIMLFSWAVGTAIQMRALTELSSLYGELGETQKQQSTQARINQLEKQRKQLMKRVPGL